MHDRIRNIRTLTVLVLAMCAAAAGPVAPAAASEPASINEFVTASRELTTDQRRRIGSYASYWSNELLSDDIERARRAKRRLMDPFRSPGIRRIFRDEYSRATIPELNKVLAAQNTFAAVNAIQVVAEFPNEAALSVIREHCDSNREPRWQVRLWASRGLGRVATTAEDIPPRTIDAAVRDLARAGEREEHWLVLLRQFESLAAVDSERGREAQVTLLSDTLARVAESEGPSDFMQAVHRSLVLLRNQFVDPSLPSSQLRSLGTEVAPLLGQVLEIGIMHWDTATTDDEASSTYQRAIGVAENLLAILDSQVRDTDPPDTSLNRSWGNGNRSSYEADIVRWRQVLDRPPYQGRR